MRRNPLPLIVAVIAITLFVIPVGLGFFETGTSTCPLAVANAQDNPCLVQDATISAQEVQILQLQMTNTALQGTLSALEAGGNSTAAAGSQASTPGLPFVDEFDDNSMGWDLKANGWGSVRLSRGALVVGIKPGAVWYLIPDIKVSSEFYAEMTVLAPDRGNDSPLLGFALGDYSSGLYHAFTAGTPSALDGLILYYEGSNGAYSSFVETDAYPPFWDGSTDVTIGLEAAQGLFTLYVNGEATETVQIEPYGADLGIWLRNRGYGERDVYIDSITVRQSR